MIQVLDRAWPVAEDKAGMSNVVTVAGGSHFIVADHVVKYMYEVSQVPSANNFTQTLIFEYRAHSKV